MIEVISQIRSAFSVLSTELPDGWTEENPSRGQCHVSSLILYQIYGGRILRGLINGEVVHYWNEIDGITIDITRDQFDLITHISDITDATDEKINDTTRIKTVILLMNIRPE